MQKVINAQSFEYIYFGVIMVEKKVETLTNTTNFYTNLIYFIVVVCFVIIRILATVFSSQLNFYVSYALGIITQLGLLFFLPLLLFKLLSKSKFKDIFSNFRFKKISYKSVLVAVGLGFLVFFLNVYISSFFNSIIQLFGYKPSSSSSSLPSEWWFFFLNLFCTAILPAICEEFLHRGMLLSGNSCYGVKKSIIISGFLFGLLHLNIEQFFYATIIGLFLGYVCWSTDSIYPCMIVHFINNASSVFLSFARSQGWGIGNMFSYISKFLTSNAFIGFMIFILFFCLLVMLAIEATKFLIKDSLMSDLIKQKKKFTSMFVRNAYFSDIEKIKNGDGADKLKTKGDDNKKVIFVDVNELLGIIGNNMNRVLTEIENQEKRMTTSITSKIFMYGSIVLSAIVTIMTFIWGLL